MSSHRRPHVVAFPFPIPGHINPLMHLCKGLASELGFRITFVNNQDNHKRMIESRPNDDDGIELVGIPDGLLDGEGAHPPSGMDGLNEVIKSTDGMRAALEKFIQGAMVDKEPVTCLIADTFIGWTQDVANKFGILRVAFSTTSATWDLIGLHFNRLIEEGFIPVSARTSGDKFVTFIPGIPPLSPSTLAWYEEYPILHFMNAGYQRMLEADWVLSSTFQALEHEAIQTMQQRFMKNFVPIGPFLPQAFLSEQVNRHGLCPEAVGCLEWLDSRATSSVLYVSFGSIAVLSAEQLVELACGLEASQQSFLLVMRPTLVEDFPEEFYKGFVQRTEGRAHVISWAPQLHVLQHPAVGGFLTHCGWNSTMESVCMGVPMIGWPWMAEQNLNCMFLVDHKLALRLQDRKDSMIDKAEIERLARVLMTGDEGKEMRKRVGVLKDEARKAVAAGGSSYSNLQAFAQAMEARAAGLPICVFTNTAMPSTDSHSLDDLALFQYPLPGYVVPGSILV